MKLKKNQCAKFQPLKDERISMEPTPWFKLIYHSARNTGFPLTSCFNLHHPGWMTYRGYFTGRRSVSRKTLPKVLNVRTSPKRLEKLRAKFFSRRTDQGQEITSTRTSGKIFLWCTKFFLQEFSVTFVHFFICFYLIGISRISHAPKKNLFSSR